MVLAIYSVAICELIYLFLSTSHMGDSGTKEQPSIITTAGIAIPAYGHITHYKKIEVQFNDKNNIQIHIAIHD